MSRALDLSPLGRGTHALGASRNQVLARDLAGSAPTIEESWTGGAVLELCTNHPQIPSFAVIEGGGQDHRPHRTRAPLLPTLPAAVVRRLQSPSDRAAGDARGDGVVDAATPIEGVKELIAYRYPQAISSGFAIVE